MKRLLKLTKALSDGVDRVAFLLMMFYMIAVTILVILGVVLRQIGLGLAWSEEVARWFLIGLAFVGASVAFKRQEHIAVLLFTMKAPAPLRRLFLIAANIVVLIFLGFSVRYGWSMAVTASRQMGAVVEIPMIYSKMNIPLGAFLMLIHCLYFLVGLLADKSHTSKYMISSSGIVRDQEVL